LNEVAAVPTPEYRALVEREFSEGADGTRSVPATLKTEREFPEGAAEWKEGGEGRRAFLKIMGASMALAGLASCRRWPEDHIAPYAHRPANRMDGVPVHYATAYEIGGMGYGVIATSFDGRPIKVDGNPAHPLTRGASDAFLQASVLNVYDPDRSRGPVKRQVPKDAGATVRTEATWGEFEAAVKGIDRSKLVVLAEASRSPSVARLRGELIKAGAKWFEYEAISDGNQREGARRVFGRPLRVVPRLDEAKVIVSIDADLFGPGEALSIKYNREFAAGRRLRETDPAKIREAEMNRLYVIESGFSVTGSMADHRKGMRPSEILAFMNHLGAAFSAMRVASNPPASLATFLSALIKDLQEHKGQAVVVAGWRQPPEVHAAAALINAAINAPVDYFAEEGAARGAWKPHGEQLKDFASAVTGAGAVLILGANPVLAAPLPTADLPIGDLLRGHGQVTPTPLTIHAGLYEDETAQVCQWHVPVTHFLEAWGDVRTFDGTVSITQPLIEPIFGARSALELLALLLGKGEAKGFDLVRETARSDYMNGRFSEWAWKKALHEGFVEETARKPEPVGAPQGPLEMLGRSGALPEYELALAAGSLHDGRFANNAWLMELPDPMTRVAWENPLLVSPKTAATLGVESDDVVLVKTPACQAGIEAAVYILPGQPDGTVSMALGYGRKGIGGVADGIGANAYALRAGDSLFIDIIKIEKVGDKKRQVPCVQDHHVIDKVGKDRLHVLVPELVVEGTLEEYRKKPALETRKVVALSMFNERRYDKGEPFVMAKWGMAIDLTACTGCSACVTACQAENNVPVVGKEMVYRGREMHWLRVDRYFKFPQDASGQVKEQEPPAVVHQPMFCQHCENAPCEEVCPVVATTHSHEGINMMTYNRCIGTRYCSNNCPYKVRRFNFFDYNAGHAYGGAQNLYTPNLLRDDLDELAKMQKNPQVTVRSRGVMEKCTYCVQRIEAARIDLLALNRKDADKAVFTDGMVQTACQQACPADAIVFGDLNDPNSRVAKLHALAQSYRLLDPELNTKPRTEYLAKVRNPVAKSE
jgi:molybdopterin-containing oxidoreductase family iron-sulfur binding subunit